MRPESTFGMPEIVKFWQVGRLVECALVPILAAIVTCNKYPRVTALMLLCSFVVLAAGWLYSSLPSTALFALFVLPLGFTYNLRDDEVLKNLATAALMITVASLPFLYFWTTTYCGYAALKLWRLSKVEP